MSRPGPDAWEDWSPFSAPYVEVEMAENPEVAVLYGPKGEPIRCLRQRRHVPFGFQAVHRDPKEPQC